MKEKNFRGVDVVVGGGYGEGKGQISSYLARKRDYSIILRISSPQAGHSIVNNCKKIALTTLPCGSVTNKNSRILLGAGSLVYVPKLLKELNETGLVGSERFGIDHRASIVTNIHLAEEKGNQNLMTVVGSVGAGAGPCRRDRLMRMENFLLARDLPELKPYLTDVVKEIYSTLQRQGKILLEGDHGFQLSLIHGEYPTVTSRDTTAMGFLSEAGINPFSVRNVYLCLKPYATRVGNGRLEEELTDEDILSWAHEKGGEIGSVSGRKRRIGMFEYENVRRAMIVNGATDIAITHMDIFQNPELIKFFGTEEDFLNKIERKICSEYPFPQISLLSYGLDLGDVKELK